MQFRKVFAVLSLSVAAMATPNAPQPGAQCYNNVAGQYACCNSTTKVNKSSQDILPKLFNALHAPNGSGGLLSDLIGSILDAVTAIIQIPIDITAGIGCMCLHFQMVAMTPHANLIFEGSIDINDCKVANTCCNFGDQVQGRQGQEAVSFPELK
jgi:hypothetical protein